MKTTNLAFRWFCPTRLIVILWKTVSSIQPALKEHQYYHDNTMSTMSWSTGTAPSTTLASQPNRTGGWQILSMSTNAASSAKHHICAHSSPKEFGGELLSNLHNLLCVSHYRKSLRLSSTEWLEVLLPLSLHWSSHGQAEACDCHLWVNGFGPEEGAISLMVADLSRAHASGLHCYELVN